MADLPESLPPIRPPGPAPVYWRVWPNFDALQHRFNHEAWPPLHQDVFRSMMAKRKPIPDILALLLEWSNQHQLIIPQSEVDKIARLMFPTSLAWQTYWTAAYYHYLRKSRQPFVAYPAFPTAPAVSTKRVKKKKMKRRQARFNTRAPRRESRMCGCCGEPNRTRKGCGSTHPCRKNFCARRIQRATTSQTQPREHRQMTCNCCGYEGGNARGCGSSHPCAFGRCLKGERAKAAFVSSFLKPQ